MAPKTVVFVDYQNVHFTALESFCDYQAPPEHHLIDPVALASLVTRHRAPGGDLQAIRIYRGRPSPDKQRTLTAANDRQAEAWKRDERVTVIRRPLKYPRGYGEAGCYERPREKGIDVSLAVDVVRMAIRKEYEVGIILSRDTDLVPAIEAVVELGSAHIEVATWAGASRLRLPSRKLWCHYLSRQDFETVSYRES